MSGRVKFSIFIIGLGFITAMLPFKNHYPNELKPSELLQKSQINDFIISVDKVARFIANEDSTIQIIDLRNPDEYREANIPGSINIPYKNLLNKDFEGYLNQKKIKNILYSNGEIISAQAWTICTGAGYQNIFIMQGGLNEWYNTVMNTEYNGERISARENALFESRFKARKLFNEMNSLPDSLKIKFMVSKKSSKKKLDGGCG